MGEEGGEGWDGKEGWGGKAENCTWTTIKFFLKEVNCQKKIGMIFY